MATMTVLKSPAAEGRVPLLGAAIGAAMGGLSGSVVDVGIDDFITQVRDQVTPGTSALFLLTSDAVADRVIDGFRGTEMELVTTESVPGGRREAAHGVRARGTIAALTHPESARRAIIQT
jgi:hypothetical protein